MPETKVTVELPDGAELELENGATGADAAAAIGPGLAKAALAIKADGELRDLCAPLSGGERIEIVTDKSPEALELVRHDAAHVLAEAVLDLWPAAKISIGPPIADGFYYDIDFPDGERPGEEDLARIEERMREHIAADEPFELRELSAAEAIEHFRAEGQDYKVELIEDLVRDEGAETVTAVPQRPLRGPLPRAARPLDRAHRRLQADLARRRLLARRRDPADADPHLRHRLSRSEATRRAPRAARAGARAGSPQARPRAGPVHAAARGARDALLAPQRQRPLELMEAEVRKQLRKRGYQEIKTPEVLDEELWHRSGHWDNYKENMFFVESEDRRFALKPMNCPGACLVFGSTRHSYRELPLRLAEFGKVFRNEREGVLHGLLRVRAFTQDDAHVYCTEEQITAEVVDIVEAIDELYARFGFEDVQLELSTRPEKSIGTDEQWERAEAALKEALDSTGREYQLNPGDGAFYGPKIDFHVTDALGRSWQLGTCQLDFFMPERFDLTYTGADNAEHRPVMIHRALLGSMERFAGILIEHHGGRLPLWLAPVQALLLPVADRHNEFARARRRRASPRPGSASGWTSARSLSAGRSATPSCRRRRTCSFVGDREQEAGKVAVRSPRGGRPGRDVARAAGRASAPSCLSGAPLPILASMPGTNTTTRR